MPATKKQKTKTEDGKSFPASAYAYVPDPEKPSTWKLKLFDTPGDEKPSVRLTAAAAQALSPSGFRGNRVQIPAADLPKVRAKVASAYLRARGTTDRNKLPRSIRKGMDHMPGDGGLHWHELDRDEGMAEHGGAHSHVFMLQGNTMLVTNYDGEHAHALAEGGNETAKDGAHRHKVRLMDGDRIKTDVGGSHSHELTLNGTGNDGSHKHSLKLPDGTAVESMTPGEFAETHKSELALDLDEEGAEAFARLAGSLPVIAKAYEGLRDVVEKVAGDLVVVGSSDAKVHATAEAVISDLVVLSKQVGDHEVVSQISRVVETLKAAQEFHQVEKADGFKPPANVAAAARRGLKLRSEHGRGGTAVGIARARDLANRKEVSRETVMRMVSFFARHGAQGADKAPAPGEDPSNGYIAWLLWGGDPGMRWAKAIADKVEKAEDGVDNELAVPQGGDEFEFSILSKSDDEDDEDDEERTVFGIVLEPEVVDAQDDIYSEDEIRKTAYKFMERYQQFGFMHKQIVDSILPLESYIAPTSFKVGTQKVKKGSWLLRVRVLDDEIWKAVRSGELTGFSIGGSAIRRPDVVKS